MHQEWTNLKDASRLIGRLTTLTSLSCLRIACPFIFICGDWGNRTPFYGVTGYSNINNCCLFPSILKTCFYYVILPLDEATNLSGVRESNSRLRLGMLKINLINCCTFSFVWKQVNLFNVVLTTRRTPRLRCWGDSNPRISAVTGRHPNQLNDSTVCRETKTKCVTITPYIGTYKPMQQDSNPHLSFTWRKFVEKLL